MTDTWKPGDRVVIIDKKDGWYGRSGTVKRVSSTWLSIAFGGGNGYLGNVDMGIPLDEAHTRISTPRRNT